jgi:hypothetical protein
MRADRLEILVVLELENSGFEGGAERKLFDEVLSVLREQKAATKYCC